MRVIEATEEFPQIHLYEDAEELKSATSVANCLGFFDPEENTIHSTAESLPHELGHYLDFKSGKMQTPDKDEDVSSKNLKIIRNEIVALLFAFTKTSYASLRFDYEKRFIEWLKFECHHSSLSKKNLSELSFSEIQALADQLSQKDFKDQKRLQFIFKAYLDGHWEVGYQGLLRSSSSR